MKIILGLFSYGGVEEQTVDSVIKELAWAGQNGKKVGYHRFSGDALIARSRSRVLGNFYRQNQADVLVMVDHDIEWRPGDLTKMAEQAVEKNALVGGLYCKRARGKGWSSRVPELGTVTFGEWPGKLVETPALATGFLAIPRAAVEEILGQLYIESDRFLQKMESLHKEGKIGEMLALHDLSIGRIKDGAWKVADHDYYDFFRCFRVPSGNKDAEENINQFLSEDWAFSHRAVYCGIKSYLSTAPVLTHHGMYGYTLGDGMDEEAIAAHQEHLNGKNGNAKRPKNANKRARRNKGSVRNK